MGVDTYVVQKATELCEADLYNMDDVELRELLIELRAYCEFAKRLKEREAEERERLRN